MLTIRRLDFTTTINALLTVACRHAARLEGAPQRALDDITSHLHTIDRLIATHRLADALNGPIPAPTLPHQVNGENEEDDDEALSLDDEPAPKRWAKQQPFEADPRLATRSSFPALATTSNLSPSATIILDYIRANPGCTGAEISAATGYSIPSIQTNISGIRKTIPIHGTRSGGKNGVSSYRT